MLVFFVQEKIFEITIGITVFRIPAVFMRRNSSGNSREHDDTHYYRCRISDD